MLLADTAVRYAAEFARRYDMVKPIEIHNALVNLGLRKRGLCYQCAEDMYVRLRELKLKTLQLHWGVAHKNDMWLEHSGVIVTARGHPFSEGLVVDGWRHSGRLRWALVSHDRYPWVKMFKRNFPELREEAVREAELAADRQYAKPPARPATQPVASCGRSRCRGRVSGWRVAPPPCAAAAPPAPPPGRTTAAVRRRS